MNAQFLSVNAEYNNRCVRSKRAVLYDMNGKKVRSKRVEKFVIIAKLIFTLNLQLGFIQIDFTPITHHIALKLHVLGFIRIFTIHKGKIF